MTLPPIIKRLFLVLTVTGIATILFGINMLMPLLLPGLLGVVVFFVILLPLPIILMGLLTLSMVVVTQKLQRGAATKS